MSKLIELFTVNSDGDYAYRSLDRGDGLVNAKFIEVTCKLSTGDMQVFICPHDIPAVDFAMETTGILRHWAGEPKIVGVEIDV